MVSELKKGKLEITLNQFQEKFYLKHKETTIAFSPMEEKCFLFQISMDLLEEWIFFIVNLNEKDKWTEPVNMGASKLILFLMKKECFGIQKKINYILVLKDTIQWEDLMFLL